MGRYPLKTTIREYMDATRDYNAPKTVQNREIVLSALERRFAEARKLDSTLKAEPANWGEPELRAIMLDMRTRGISLASQRSELSMLKGLLRFTGNSALDQLRAKHPHIFPKPISERKPSLNGDQLAEVLKATDEIAGWRGECIRFVMATYAHTGLRLSELRMAEAQDLDLKNWTLRVSHPKGEATYGQARVVPIPEPLKPVTIRFLRERDKLLAQHKLLGSKPLVFNEATPGQPVAKNTIESWVQEIRELSGVEFTAHTLRRTYGQNLLNRGASIEVVSIALGHSSTVTTEKHYCRKDADLARFEIVQAYARSDALPTRQSGQIERKAQITGYA